MYLESTFYVKMILQENENDFFSKWTRTKHIATNKFDLLCQYQAGSNESVLKIVHVCHYSDNAVRYLDQTCVLKNLVWYCTFDIVPACYIHLWS